MEKQERKEKKILTENRMTTVNKREMSYEGLASQLENGEDGIYNLMNENKNQIFQPKVTITKKDLEEIEPLRQLREAIDAWEAKLKVTEGKDAFIIKKAIIEMRKDQYIIKDAYRKPIIPRNIVRSKHEIELHEDVLMTYASDIKSVRGLVKRQEKLYSDYIVDHKMLTQVQRKVSKVNVGTVGTTNGSIILTVTN